MCLSDAKQPCEGRAVREWCLLQGKQPGQGSAVQPRERVYLSGPLFPQLLPEGLHSCPGFPYHQIGVIIPALSNCGETWLFPRAGLRMTKHLPQDR